MRKKIFKKYALPALVSMSIAGFASNEAQAQLYVTKLPESKKNQVTKLDSVYFKEPVTINIFSGPYKSNTDQVFDEKTYYPDGSMLDKNIVKNKVEYVGKYNLTKESLPIMDSLEFYIQRTNIPSMDGKSFKKPKHAPRKKNKYVTYDDEQYDLTFSTSKDTFKIHLDSWDAGPAELQKIQNMIMDYNSVPHRQIDATAEKIKYGIPVAKFDSVYTKEPITIIWRQNAGFVSEEYKNGFYEATIFPDSKDAVLLIKQTDGVDSILTSRIKLNSPYNAWIDSLQWYAQRINTSSMKDATFKSYHMGNGRLGQSSDGGAVDLSFITKYNTVKMHLNFPGAGTLELHDLQQKIDSVINRPMDNYTLLETIREALKK